MTILKYLIKIFILLILSGIQTYAVATHALIVDEKKLLGRIDDQNILIIDVRNHQQYTKSHIKNAINLPVSETFSKGERNDLVAPLSDIVKLFGQAGIDTYSHIILYDNGSLTDAARFFWILEIFGHEKVSILNSGFRGWSQRGNPVSSVVRHVSPVIFIPSVSPDKLATFLSVRVALDNPEHVLIDVRPRIEYLGKASKTGYFGHIPTAINIPFDLNLNANHFGLRPLAELTELYKMLNKKKSVTVYCNKGKQSALSYFVLRHLEYNVSAYDGSWFEWGRIARFPQHPLNIDEN